ncbi:glycosyltransferase family 2 protein [Sphingomonas sp.]|uniref:glycosyltransferase family 2 protein n=1 Tax=Sphingomonas sp. TaxID=28214 RepID=UPI00289DE776|nr:glycosyltransferase family 2 protein [Sphingomonas sp.]
MMTMLADVLLFVGLLVLMPAVLLFVAEILSGLRAPITTPPGNAPAFTVLIPAHDEAGVIVPSLRSIAGQLRDGDRMLVIADNCSDDTAAIAAAHGADVTERHDPIRRGKGYALAHGLAHAARWGHAVTIIVDADCLLSPGALRHLAAAAGSGRPVQGDYCLEAAPGGSRASRFSAFAIRIKNYVRLLGGKRLGVPCVLTGSGMAFPTALLSRVELGSGEIVEDLLLAVDLTLHGAAPRFCPEARITSPLPATREAAEAQRARWEGGYLSIMRRYALRLAGTGLRRGDARVLALALDLAIPPLSLLIAGQGALLILTAFWALLSGHAAPFAVAVVQMAMMIGAIALAWHRYGRDLLSAGDLARLPLSVLA